MPPRRIRPLLDPVWLYHDGERLQGERGEPIALTLLAAGRSTLARSPKLHRARGPYCLSGSCDGCLCRVNGEPNVMTCLTPTAEGDQVETQNSLGSRTVDPLSVTDLAFPHGFDHHRLLAGVPALGALFAHGARRLAGLGEYPSASPQGRAGRIRQPDVLIVGGGEAGARAALELRREAPHLSLLWVERGLFAGGRLALTEPHAWAALEGELRAPRRPAEAALAPELGTTLIGLYAAPEVVSAATRGAPPAPLAPLALLTRREQEGAPRGVDVIRPRAVILAVGHHPPSQLFGNNDLPGIYSARAALTALRAGVLVGERLVLVGEGDELEALSGARGFELAARLSLSEFEAAVGPLEVRGVRYRRGEALETVSCDAVVVGAPGAPAFELAVQAGLPVRFEPQRGFFAHEPMSDCSDAGATSGATNPPKKNTQRSPAPSREAGQARQPEVLQGAQPEARGVSVAHRHSAVRCAQRVLRALSQ